MSSVLHQRCFHHGPREAVAQCPECRRFFCRECITEHDDRVICASCLVKLVARAARRPDRGRSLRAATGCAAAVVVLWIFFYGWGRLLLSLPSSFHEGTLWKEALEEME